MLTFELKRPRKQRYKLLFGNGPFKEQVPKQLLKSGTPSAGNTGAQACSLDIIPSLP